MFAETISEIFRSMLEALLAAREIRKRPPPPPTEPNRLEFFSMTLGLASALAGGFGFAVYTYETRLERHIARTPVAHATIISATRKQEGHHFTDALLDYERQSPADPVPCVRASARFDGWSDTFAVGRTVDVYPQDGSCYRPIYAPDIGNPLPVLIVSAICMPTGLAIFAGTLGSYRQRRRQFED
jgi:hypothetical protein